MTVETFQLSFCGLVCAPHPDISSFSPLLGPVDRLGGLVVIAPARRPGDLGSIPGPGENFFILNY